MAKQTPLTRLDFLKRIDARELSGAWLLDGPEEHLRAEAVQRIRAWLLPEGFEALNEAVLDAPPADAVTAACETLPFAAEKRLVILRDLPGLTGRQDAEDALCAYLPRVPDTCLLLALCREKADSRKKLTRAFAALGHIVTFDRMRESELTDWVMQAFTASGKVCSPRAAQQLIFTAGSDTQLLTGEIAKLASAAGDRPEITADDISAVATRSAEYNVFQLTDLVVQGKQAETFARLRDLLTQGQDRLGILSLLLRHYRMLQHIKIMQYEHCPPQEMAEALGLRAFAMDIYTRQARQVSGGEVRDAVQLCLETENAVKSGLLNEEGSLEAMLLRLFAMKRSRRAK